MRRLLVIAAASLAIALVAAGCGGKSSSSSKSASPSPSQTTAGGAPIDVRTSKLGSILVDGSGRTLYLFEKDKGTTSSCYGACAAGWPPYTTAGAPHAGRGASASLLGTTTRTDGKTEVTYHGHPLYYYAGDSTAGDTNGQGVEAFGAEWYVVGPAGSKVEGANS